MPKFMIISYRQGCRFTRSGVMPQFGRLKDTNIDPSQCRSDLGFVRGVAIIFHPDFAGGRVCGFQHPRDLAESGFHGASLPRVHRFGLEQHVPIPLFESGSGSMSEFTDLTDRQRLELTSQKWQGLVWKHALLVYEPKTVDHPDHMLLFVTGSSTDGVPQEKDLGMRLALAERCGARVATLHAVPNPPLLGDRYEDDLITETWLKYLETGDDSWPLLFPMVKSAVKAMDDLEQFSLEQYQIKPKGFVITGASKRGWTSWLTPVADKRVIATAPIVINMLNFPEQMKYQLETWGKYSEQINDYTSKGLIKPSGTETVREKQLMHMMAPYSYRKQLTLPKLMVVGTNDSYWVVDAMNLYWDGLEGPKYTLQVPDAGHGLDEGRDAALTTVAVFFRHQAGGPELPKLDWKYAAKSDSVHLAMTANPAPVGVRFWTADSKDKDFRDSKWTSQPLHIANGSFTGNHPKSG